MRARNIIFSGGDREGLILNEIIGGCFDLPNRETGKMIRYVESGQFDPFGRERFIAQTTPPPPRPNQPAAI